MICATITGAVAIEISSSKGSTCIDYLHIQQLVNAQNRASGNSNGGMVSGSSCPSQRRSQIPQGFGLWSRRLALFRTSGQGLLMPLFFVFLLSLKGGEA